MRHMMNLVDKCKMENHIYFKPLNIYIKIEKLNILIYQQTKCILINIYPTNYMMNSKNFY